MKNITPTLPSPLRGGGLGWGGQRAPEVKSCDHRKNRYGPLNIGATANFRNIFLQLLSKLISCIKIEAFAIRPLVLIAPPGNQRNVAGVDLGWFFPPLYQRGDFLQSLGKHK